MEYPNLKDLDHRAQHHWNIDGLAELAMGLLWMLWGLAFGSQQYFTAHAVTRVLWIVTLFLVAFGGFAANWIVLRLKRRYTFPRAGYVRIAVPKRRRMLGAAVAAAVAIGIASIALLADPGRIESFLVPSLGILFAAVFTFSAMLWKAHHYLIPAVVSVVLAVALAASHLDVQRGAPILLFSIGVVVAAVGAIRFRAFLRNNPIPTETAA